MKLTNSAQLQWPHFDAQEPYEVSANLAGKS